MKKPSIFFRAALLSSFTLVASIATAADRGPTVEEMVSMGQELTVYGTHTTGMAMRDSSLFLSWTRVGRESEGPSVSGVHVLDLENPAAPKLLWSQKGKDHASSIAVVGHNVLIAGASKMKGRETGCCRIFDTEDPSNPQLLGKVEFEGTPFYLAIGDGFACVGGYTKLFIIDVNDAAAPQMVASHQERMPPPPRWVPRFLVGPGVSDASLFWTYALAIDGNRIYVGCTDALYALDVNTLNAPQRVGLYRISNGRVRWLVVENEIACVGVAHYSRWPFGDVLDTASEELMLLDVKDFKNPRLIRKVKVPKGGGDYTFSAGIVYFSDHDRVYAYDVRDAWSSRKKPLPVTSNGAVNKQTLVVPCHGGCKVFDITEPLSPQLMTTYQVKEG